MLKLIIILCIPIHLQFRQQSVLLNIRVTYMNFSKLYVQKPCQIDFKEFPLIGHNVMGYFCVSLYTRYLSNVYPFLQKKTYFENQRNVQKFH